jgi:hypothetical protein
MNEWREYKYRRLKKKDEQHILSAYLLRTVACLPDRCPIQIAGNILLGFHDE